MKDKLDTYNWLSSMTPLYKLTRNKIIDQLKAYLDGRVWDSTYEVDRTPYELINFSDIYYSGDEEISELVKLAKEKISQIFVLKEQKIARLELEKIEKANNYTSEEMAEKFYYKKALDF